MAEKRRIFFLITELDVGGAEKSLFELATRLDRARFEPVVGCLTGRGPLGQRLEESGVPVLYFDLRGWWDLPAWRRLRRELKRRRPDVLHCFLFHASLAGRLAALRLGIQRVISAVRVEEPRRRHLWLDRLTRGLVHVVTCVSESARRYVHERVKVPLDRIVVIPNALDPTLYDGPFPDPPEDWGLPEGVPVVAAIGRLDAQKDPLLLLRAAARVVRQVPEAVFALAGSGPLEARCRAEAERLGIRDNLRLLGWVEDVRPLLGRAWLLAHTARWEGMPNVILEAMACRRPVVATAVGGCPELVEDGVTGLLVPQGRPGPMAQAIANLILDEGLRKRLGESARTRVERNFSIQAMVCANENLYI